MIQSEANKRTPCATSADCCGNKRRSKQRRFSTRVKEVREIFMLLIVQKYIYGGRCTEGLKAKTEGSTRLTYTGFHGGLGHLKIETRLSGERLEV